MVSFFRRRPAKDTSNLSLNAIPDEMYNPQFLEMHRRALRATAYGIGDIVRAEIVDDRVQFRYMRGGQLFQTVQEALEHAGAITTFTKITGDLETSSYNLRGLSNMEQRLIEMQNYLLNNQNMMNQLGIDDVNQLSFEVSTGKAGLGEEAALDSIVRRLGQGLMVPDDAEFNFLQIRAGGRLLSIKEMDELFLRSSDMKGGIFALDNLIEAMSEEKLSGVFSKSGKRFRGAIGLKDISLSGTLLEDILADAGLNQGGAKFSENIRVFKVADDLTEMADEFQRLLGSGKSINDLLKTDVLFDYLAARWRRSTRKTSILWTRCN